MHRLRSFTGRIAGLWRTGRRGKLAVGCSSIIAAWLLCAGCVAVWGLTPSGRSANASLTATRGAALAIASTTPTPRPTFSPPPTTVPATSAPATAMTTRTLVTTTATAPAAAAVKAGTPPTVTPAPVAAQATSVSAPPTPIPASATPEGPGWPAGTVRATLAEVVDGDTVKVNIDGRAETIRLIGIDTPETVDPRVGVQCFGREASNYAKELLSPGAVIGLEADPTQGERDKYDRLLRYIWLEDGTLFNLQSIAAGYAHEYTYDLPYKYQAQFQAAEAQAREAGIGLWSPATCGGNTEQLAGGAKPAPAQPQPGGGAPPAPPPQVPAPAPVAAGDALRISVTNANPEYATVTNAGAEPVTLGGWRILSYSAQCALQADQTFTFPGGFTLGPGASVNVYSGYGSSPPGDGLRARSDNIWNNEADRAELVRPDGSVVARYSYGGCR